MDINHQPHHRGSFPHTGLKLRRAWTLNPLTRCWRDGNTLTNSPPQRNGKPPRWTVGHIDHDHPAPWTIPGATLIDGHWCAPECSSHNFAHGAMKGNAERKGSKLIGGRYVQAVERRADW